MLRVIRSVDPAGGGVVESVLQVSLAMVQNGCDVEILSLDDPQDVFVRDFPLKIQALGPVASSYGYSPDFVSWLKGNAKRFDAIIIDGLWQYHSFGTWRAIRKMVPYFVYAHGMLDPWFKTNHPLKHLKKWLYWPWAEYRVLKDAHAVFFTAEEERLRSRESFWLYRYKEKVVSLGVTPPPSDVITSEKEKFINRFPALHGKRAFLFLGRIHPIKGCDILLEAFARVAARHSDVHLVMAGPDQTGWRTSLMALATRRGIQNQVTWAGMLAGQEKWGALAAAEAMVLPSHHENFGIVVAEALACGKPVLISNKVNIWHEVEADGAGLVADDTLEGTINNLERWLGMGQQEKTVVQAKAKKCFANHFHVQRAAERLLEILRESK